MEQANTLEAFIEQLHADGVEAGLKEAEQLRAAAAAQADALLEQARASARDIVAQAEAEAKSITAEGKRELALAVRDVQLELRARLERALTLLLEESLEQRLGDPELLASLLVEVVRANAGAAGAEEAFEVKVRADLASALARAVPAMLGSALNGGNHALKVEAELRTAGFEYRVADAVVEVTPESVAEKLVELVSPQLRSLLRTAAGEESSLVAAG